MVGGVDCWIGLMLRVITTKGILKCHGVRCRSCGILAIIFTLSILEFLLTGTGVLSISPSLWLLEV